MSRSIFGKLFSQKKQGMYSLSWSMDVPLSNLGPKPSPKGQSEAVQSHVIDRSFPTEVAPPCLSSRSKPRNTVQPNIFNNFPPTPNGILKRPRILTQEEFIQNIEGVLSRSAARRSSSAQDNGGEASVSFIQRNGDGSNDEGSWHTGRSDDDNSPLRNTERSGRSSVSSLHYSIFGDHPVLPVPAATLREDSLSASEIDHREIVPDLSGKIERISPHAAFEGTYSSVYVGLYKDEKVAIKVMRGVRGADSMRRKIRREAGVWWALEHPNILPFYGFDGTEGFGFGEYGALISPWCENGSASAYLLNSPSPERRVEMFGDVARGLLYLHQFNPTIVHGDLKPANVLIDEYHRAKLCDFGLVRLMHENGYTTGTTTTTAHTGTARYLPYELIETNQLPNTASDVYSLACMSLEFIHLVTPYSHIQSHQVGAHYKICRDIMAGIPPAPRPESLDHTMAEFWDLLEECWSIHPDTRPSAEGIVLYLEHRSQDIVYSTSTRRVSTAANDMTFDANNVYPPTSVQEQRKDGLPPFIVGTHLFNASQNSLTSPLVIENREQESISLIRSNGLPSIQRNGDGQNGSSLSTASSDILSSHNQSSKAYSAERRTLHSEEGSIYSSIPRSKIPIPKQSISDLPSKPHTLFAMSNLTANFDPSIALLASLRSEPVLDLTAHVKKERNRPIFEGPYSIVWYGRLDKQQYVAIKVLQVQRMELDKALRRFEREVRIWWYLRHDNVVPLWGLAIGPDFGAFGATISPWYKNGNAANYLKKNTVSVAQRINLFHDVARGVHYLHTFETTTIHSDSTSESSAELRAADTTVVHGDLKPSNILIDDNGVGKLCDFGLFRILSDNGSTETYLMSPHRGTLRYLAYEMMAPDSQPTHASDIHALACVGYEFLYSTQPYAHIDSKDHPSDFQVRKAIDEKLPPAQRPEDIPRPIPKLWNTLEKSWSLDPLKRPHASAICNFLDKYKQQFSETGYNW